MSKKHPNAESYGIQLERFHRFLRSIPIVPLNVDIAMSNTLAKDSFGKEYFSNTHNSFACTSMTAKGIILPAQLDSIFGRHMGLDKIIFNVEVKIMGTGKLKITTVPRGIPVEPETCFVEIGEVTEPFVTTRFIESVKELITKYLDNPSHTFPLNEFYTDSLKEAMLDLLRAIENYGDAQAPLIELNKSRALLLDRFNTLETEMDRLEPAFRSLDVI